MEKNFRDTLNERLKNPEFQKIYESIKKSNIEKLFENFNGEYTPVDVDFGKPVGEEILWKLKGQERTRCHLTFIYIKARTTP